MKHLIFLLMMFSILANEPGAVSAAQKTETAIFAGGCFWCMEPPFDAINGVISTTSGYTGGIATQPTYEQVSSGDTGHIEALQVVYDPSRITYQQLLDTFWRNIDPLNNSGQFCDVGPQYRAAIFYMNELQKTLADGSKKWLEKDRGWEIVTDIRPAVTFYSAEDYHQDYYRKNPLRYKFYRSGCGRDSRLQELWKKGLQR